MKLQKSAKTGAAILLTAVLSFSLAVPAFASHEVLKKDTYVLEQTEDDSTRCVSTTGEPMTGWVADEDDNLYYFDNGEMDFGWDKIEGDWYYFDPETGVLATNTTVLNYDVDEDGRMIKIHEW